MSLVIWTSSFRPHLISLRTLQIQKSPAVLALPAYTPRRRSQVTLWTCHRNPCSLPLELDNGKKLSIFFHHCEKNNTILLGCSQWKACKDVTLAINYLLIMSQFQEEYNQKYFNYCFVFIHCRHSWLQLQKLNAFISRKLSLTHNDFETSSILYP